MTVREARLPDFQDREWFARIGRGDLDAFKEFYEAHAPPLLRMACRLLNNRQDAEDAVQTSFVKFYRSIHGFRGNAKMSTYLFRIAVNTCHDLHKRRAKMKVVDFQESEGPAEKRSMELRIQLSDAISRLPLRMRTCFFLFAVEELPIRDIGEIMRLSPGGVKSTLFQARQKLRVMLADTEEDRS